MPNKYSEQERREIGTRNEAIVRGYQHGWSLRELAATHHVTYERIHQIIASAGIPRRKVGGHTYASLHAPLPPRLPWRDEIAERLRALRAGEV